MIRAIPLLHLWVCYRASFAFYPQVQEHGFHYIPIKNVLILGAIVRNLKYSEDKQQNSLDRGIGPSKPSIISLAVFVLELQSQFSLWLLHSTDVQVKAQQSLYRSTGFWSRHSNRCTGPQSSRRLILPHFQ
jgi:hypothetical protein